jgi:hypothetical protein
MAAFVGPERAGAGRRPLRYHRRTGDRPGPPHHGLTMTSTFSRRVTAADTIAAIRRGLVGT